MTQDEMRDLVKECGLDWHKGFMPLFDGDETNRYALLIEAALAAAVAAEREACALIAEDVDYCAEIIRARGDAHDNP